MPSINKTIPQTTDLRVRDIGLSGIAITIQRRALNPGVVDSLVLSMKEVGLINPITIRPREGGMGYYLVAGRHRLEGAKKLKWESIPCIVLEGITADEAELREIDENLIRANLSPAEEAAHHERRQALYEKRHPETKRGGDRKSEKSKRQNVDSKGYAADTANKIGKTRKTVERAVRRGKKIPDVASLAGTSLDKGAELDALAQMEPQQQAELIEKAKAGEQVSAKIHCPEQSAEKRKAFCASDEKDGIPELSRQSPPSIPVISPTETKPKSQPVSSPPIVPSANSAKSSKPSANTAPPLNSLSWSDATPENQRKFIDAVGVVSLWEAMSEEQQTQLINHINALQDAADAAKTENAHCS